MDAGVKTEKFFLKPKEIGDLRSEPYFTPYELSKKIFDFIVALLSLFFILPLLGILALLIKIKSPGKIIFAQERVGLHGEKFKMYKLRTMEENAEEILKKDPTLYKKYRENNFKLPPEEDPRIFSFGKFLRKTSLDELPQIFNVLKGEMSFVGPRPVVEEELEQYGHYQSKLLSVKPGLTGLWQIRGRSIINYPERALLDIEYIDKRNFLIDLKIFFQTFIILIRQKGAF